MPCRDSRPLVLLALLGATTGTIAPMIVPEHSARQGGVYGPPGAVRRRLPVGVTEGASAPEDLVQGVIRKLSGAYAVTVEEIGAARETVSFKLPRALLA